MDETSMDTINNEALLPTENNLYKVGASLIQFFRDRSFLIALYGEGRASDIMYRYFSGQTLEKIGNDYGLTRERIHQLCVKYLRRLISQISYFTKDVIEIRADRDAHAEALLETKPNRRRPWTEDDLNMIVEMKHSGKSFRTIADEMGRFAVDVKDHYYAKQEQIQKENFPRVVLPTKNVSDADAPSRPVRNQVLPWKDEDIILLRSLRSQGTSIREIARQMQRNQRSVSAKLEELGIKTHYRDPETLTKEDKVNIINLFEQGASITDLAEDYSLKQVDIATILIVNRLLPEKLSNEGKPWQPSEIKALRTFIERDYPIGEIGYRLGRNHREVTSQIYELIKSSLD